MVKTSRITSHPQIWFTHFCIVMQSCVKGPSHIQNGARRPLCELKSAFSPGWRPEVCPITAGSAAIFRDRTAFAGQLNLFLIQRFSNGRNSDLRNMTCKNFRCPIYARSGRRAEPAWASPGVSTDLLYRPGFARLLLVYWRAPGDFWSLVFEGHRPSPVPKFEIRRRLGDLQFRPEIVGYVT